MTSIAKRIVLVPWECSYVTPYPPFYLFYNETANNRWVVCIGDDPHTLMWEDTYLYTLHGQGD